MHCCLLGRQIRFLAWYACQDGVNCGAPDDTEIEGVQGQVYVEEDDK